MNNDNGTTMIKSNITLAENVDFDTYDLTPLDSFGKNILMKFSLKESSSLVGNKRKAPEKVIEYKPRNHRSGLGYDVTKENNDDVNSNNNHNKSIQNNQMDNYYGRKIKIIGGRHEGLKGIIVEEIKCEDINRYFKHNKYTRIQLNNSRETTKIKSKYIKLRSKHNEQNEHQNTEQEGNKREKYDSNKYSHLKKEKLKWIQQGLIVRIIKKESQYYNTKVKVEDVIDDYTFSIITNNNVIYNDFQETDCETVIPQVNSDVVILSSEIKGQLGKLIERNKRENKVFVQVYDDLSIIELTQDDICLFKK